MAETFPVGFAEIDLVPNPGIRYARTEGGLLITGRNRDTFFGGRLTTGTLLQPEWADLVAALVDAVERNLRFDLVLPRFQRPRAYIGVAWPLIAVPTIEDVTNLHTLSVAGLDIGMTLKRGDRFTLHKGGLRCHRMLSADVTVASATAQAIPFSPRLPIGVFEAADEVHFIDPAIRLAVLGDTLSLPEKYSPTPISIDVAEALA